MRKLCRQKQKQNVNYRKSGKEKNEKFKEKKNAKNEKENRDEF